MKTLSSLYTYGGGPKEVLFERKGTVQTCLKTQRGVGNSSDRASAWGRWRDKSSEVEQKRSKKYKYADVEGRGYDKFKETDLTFSVELECDKSETEKIKIFNSHLNIEKKNR